MKKSLIIIIILLNTILISAEELTKEEVWEQVQDFKGQKVFAPLDKYYSNEIANVVFLDTEERIYGILEDGELTTVELGEHEDPTMVVEIDSFNTINSILNSENPIDQFVEEKDDKTIIFKPQGFIKKAKYYVYRDSELTMIKMTKKQLASLLSSDKVSEDSILEFIKQNKLCINDEADLLQVFEFVNK